MDASMWVAKTGLSAQSTRMTVIANNLANVNTIGFKKDRANFEDHFTSGLFRLGPRLMQLQRLRPV
jgi:flagellar basal-body rod protein FlgG